MKLGKKKREKRTVAYKIPIFLSIKFHFHNQTDFMKELCKLLKILQAGHTQHVLLASHKRPPSNACLKRCLGAIQIKRLSAFNYFTGEEILI